MNRRTAAAMLALALLLSLAACAGKPESTGVGAKLDTVQPPQQAASGAAQESRPEQPQSAQPDPPDTGKTARPDKSRDPQPGPSPDPAPADGPEPLDLCISYDYRYDYLEGTQRAVDARWPAVLLAQQARTEGAEIPARRYPALSAALDALAEDLTAAHEEQYSRLHDLAAGEQGAELYWNTDVYIRRADSTVLSVLFRTDAYSGGVHPDYWFSSAAFDTDSGEQIPLSDVVTDMFALPGVLEELLLAQYPHTEFFDLRATLESLTADGGLVWTADTLGLTFWFSPYAISSYADGAQAVTVSYSDYPELFIPALYELPAQTATQLTAQESVPVDGRTLRIDAPANEYGFIERYTLSFGGSTLTEECWCFRLAPYLCTLADGSRMLLVVAESENDYTVMTLYALEGGRLREVDAMEPTSLDSRMISETRWAQDVLTDPSFFCADTRIQLLGTMSAEGVYALTRTGFRLLFEPLMVPDGRPLVSKTELEVTSVLDGETLRVPAGSTFTPFSTDGESYMDLQLDDGRICRLELTRAADEWNYRVKANGLSVEDAFENILYAG